MRLSSKILKECGKNLLSFVGIIPDFDSPLEQNNMVLSLLSASNADSGNTMGPTKLSPPLSMGLWVVCVLKIILPADGVIPV